MWDLDSIIQQNNSAAIEWMQQGLKTNEAQEPHPEGWALSTLAEKMRAGPIHINTLLACFEEAKEMQPFVDLIKQFLPGEEKAIMSLPRQRRVYKFCHLFSKRYFPLPTGTFDGSVAHLLAGLPVDIMGMSYSAYHDLDFRPGYLLMLSLVPYPYEGSERDLWAEEEGGTPGGRIPLLDLVQRMVGAELAHKIPEEGWTPEELRAMTDGTKYDGVGQFAEWVLQATGCVALDANYGNCEFMEGYGEPIFQWSKHNVDKLTEQWPQVKSYRARIDRMVDWLETSPSQTFQELLDFLLAESTLKLAKSGKRGKKKARHIYNDEAHYIPLDQDMGEENEDEE